VLAFAIGVILAFAPAVDAEGICGKGGDGGVEVFVVDL
jgi:hypothetical protein